MKYEVIATYPESPYKVGDIEDGSTWSENDSLDNYPAIFRKIERSEPEPPQGKTMEEFIDGLDKFMEWGTGNYLYNRNEIRIAMSEWAAIQTAEKDEAIRELVEGLEAALPYVHDVGLENEERVKTKSLIQKHKQ